MLGGSGRAAQAATGDGRPAVAALSLAVLLSSLGTSITNVALPTLAATLPATFAEVQSVVLAYLLASTATVVAAGRLGDLLGQRRLLLAGLGLFTAASLAGAMAPSFGALVAARAAQGLGAAIMLALGLALVGETVPRAQLGRAMGLLGTMSAVGTALGPALGGAAIAACGWRCVFLVLVPLGLLALLLAHQGLPASRRRQAPAGAFDGGGAVLLALVLCGAALATTRGHGGAVWSGVALPCAALAGLGLFVWVERRAASPLVDLAALREPGLAGGLATAMLVATVMMATLVVGPFHLARALHLEAAQVGLLMAVGPFAAAVAGVPAGRVVDRWGVPRAVLAGLAGIAAGAGMLAVLSRQGSVPGYVVPVVGMTAAYALFQAANNTLVVARAAPDRRGVVSGLLNLARNLGLMLGTTLLGAVFASAGGAGDPASARAHAVAQGTGLTFGVATLLVGLALGIAVASQAALGRPPAPAPERGGAGARFPGSGCLRCGHAPPVRPAAGVRRGLPGRGPGPTDREPGRN